MLDHLTKIAGQVEADWNRGLDPRRMAYAIADAAGVPIDWQVIACGKGVVLSGQYAIKTGGPWQISDSVRCAELLGERYAKIHAHGRLWMIQERVKPLPDARAFHRFASQNGVADTRNNAGQRESGEVVAFDGFPLNKGPLP